MALRRIVSSRDGGVCLSQATVEVDDLLKASLGFEVVVDYTTNSGRSSFAKGRLISAEKDRIVISNHKRLWIIMKSQMLTFVVEKGDVAAS